MILTKWPLVIGIISVLFLTMVIRLPAVSQDLPYEYGWDEPEIMLPAVRLLREGVYIPYKFDYGPLNGYTHAAWGALSFVRGLGHKQFPNGIWGIQSDNVTGWYWTVTSPYLLRQARILSTLLAMLSVGFVYFAALKLWRRVWPAFFAAGLVAVNGAFTGQTVLVSADATTIAAACVTLWASVHIYLSRERWAYVTAGIAAAAAMAYKYNNVFVALLPFLAHFLSASKGVKHISYLNLVRYFLWFTVAAIVFMLPVFFQPTRFLHDVSTVLGYYAVPKDSTIWSTMVGFLQRGLSLLDMGRVGAPGKGIQSVNELRFNMRWAGIGTVLSVAAGLIAAIASRKWKLLALVLPIIALNFMNVGGDTGFFFPRYLLLSLPFLSLLGGFAIVSAEQLLPQSRYRHYIIAGICLILLAPSIYSVGRKAYAANQTSDPRTEMASFIDRNVPAGSKLLILDELRWHVTAPETKKYKIARANVMQLRQQPELLNGYDYLLAPRSVYFHSPTNRLSSLATEINAWLAPLTAAKKYGSAAIAFNGPDVEPAVQLVRLPLVAAAPTSHIPKDQIEGMTFIGENSGGTMLGNGYLCVRAGASVSGKVELSKNTTAFVVTAQGTAPYQQKKAPELIISLKLADADPGAAAAFSKAIALDRSQGGLNEYGASASLPKGVYRVTVQAKDEDNFHIRLQNITFR